MDGQWAAQHGYETYPGNEQQRLKLCLGGPRYAGQFQQRLVELVGRSGVRQLKLDGYDLVCPAPDHGHQPGPLSAEAIAAGAVAAMDAAHRTDPAVWIETTCFGYSPSPWWLFHANSVIGTFGHDAPSGRVPAPVYRESYTTDRDFFNLQGAALLPLPIAAQEVLGIIVQSPEPFLNDAVTVALRGHEFLPVYVNPKYMTDARWSALAKLLKWTRENQEILAETVPLLPGDWQGGGIPRFTDEGKRPRQPYGYAHVKHDAGLVALRNPWIAPQSYRFKLDGDTGFSADAQGLSLVSLYPEPRLYAENLKFGDAVEVPLAPYETLVLSVDLPGNTAKAPPAAVAVRKHLTVEARTCAIEDRRLTCHAKVVVASPRAELLLLCEGDKAPAVPAGRLTVNGREVRAESHSSETGWSVGGQRQHWLFLTAPLSSGENEVGLDYALGDGCEKVSVWVWATKPGNAAAPAFPGALPQPETISLDGATLLDAIGQPP